MIYPCMILADRYGGTYSGAPWIAFNIDGLPEEENCVPQGVNTGDIESMDFWWTEGSREEHPQTAKIGRGATPSDAYADLLRRLGQ